MALPDGLYDLLLTEGLARSLAELDPARTDVSALKGGAAGFLTDVITRQLSTILDDVSGDEAEKAKRQLELVNELLVMLGAAAIILCTSLIGLVPSCLIYILLWLKLVEHAPWKAIITIEIIMAAIILGVFTTWLQIRFPVGLLGSLLGL